MPATMPFMDDQSADKASAKSLWPRVSISLGPEPLHSKRLAALDTMAAHLGVNRSKLIQLIADGHLLLTVPNIDAASEQMNSQ